MNGREPTMPQGGAAPVAGKSPVMLIGVVVLFVLAAAGALYWYAMQLPQPAPAGVTAEPPVGTEIEEPDLGTEIYEKAANPLSEKLPETVAPLPNPLEETYKNPFE